MTYALTKFRHDTWGCPLWSRMNRNLISTNVHSHEVLNLSTIREPRYYAHWYEWKSSLVTTTRIYVSVPLNNTYIKVNLVRDNHPLSPSPGVFTTSWTVAVMPLAKVWCYEAFPLRHRAFPLCVHQGDEACWSNNAIASQLRAHYPAHSSEVPTVTTCWLIFFLRHIALCCKHNAYLLSY